MLPDSLPAKLPQHILASLCFALGLQAGQPVLHTAKWANNNTAFAEFAARIEENHPRNLLARKGVRSSGAEAALTDGQAGARGGAGRVNISGQPTTLTYYLGAVKPIHRVGFYTFNIDARANQDYEVRFATNTGHPGEQPTFGKKADLTSGAAVIGPNKGGFHSWFEQKDGTPITRADWVQFRIWRTYNVKVGHPAHSTQPSSWTAAIELEIHGAKDDVVHIDPAILARRKALREALRLLPPSPEFRKNKDWWHSMVASREAILQWETKTDRLLVEISGARFGPWFVLGPVKNKGQEDQQLTRAGTVNLGKPLSGGLRWRPAPEIRDGDTLDLAKVYKLKPGQTLFLARTAEFQRAFDRRRPYAIGLGLGDGEARIPPTRARERCAGLAGPNQRTLRVTCNPGDYHVLLRAPVRADGTCPFWFMPQPSTGRRNAGNEAARRGRRMRLFQTLRNEFPDALSQQQMDWEQWDSIWIQFKRLSMARRSYMLSDWTPGQEPVLLVKQYADATQRRIALFKADLKVYEPRIANPANSWLANFEERAKRTSKTVMEARDRYWVLCSVQETAKAARAIESTILALADRAITFQLSIDDDVRAMEHFRNRLDTAWPQFLKSPNASFPSVLAIRGKARAKAQDILLATPLLDFDKLLLVKGGPRFTSNWSGSNPLGNEIGYLTTPFPEEKWTSIHKGRVSDLDLNFDGRRILFSDGHHLREIHTDGSDLRQVSQQNDTHVMHFDGCYMPDESIVFVSTACEQAVPCTGQWHVGNLHRMDSDGTKERRLCFDQDHDWNPCVLNNGRVLFTRWEYTDTPHYFTRLLFHMNPDGTGQMEYYGSNSYWPNAMYWPRPIPGHPTMFSCIVSGHHGVGWMGELIVFDPAKGRHEAKGVVQRIPGRGRKVEPVIKDGLVGESWPRFASPYPLAEPKTNRGAGRYFLVNRKQWPWSPWEICLADVFDNVTPIVTGSYSTPIPLRPRRRPPVIPHRVNLKKKAGHVYMSDVYSGPGLKGVPRGTVKSLRVGSHHYRYGGNGDTYASSHDGGWDVKRILGTVPVEEDGSAFFAAPANTPIFVQPLDTEGKALQTMRSWFVVMPGETLSCVGCHERQNQVAPPRGNMAARKAPRTIRPWLAPTRGFGFDQEVQPVLDRRCVGCHNGTKGGPDLRAKRLLPAYKGRYSPAYNALHPYVRRAGYEADYRMMRPAEFTANTAALVQMLKKGHHGVRLEPEEWSRLYTWIDFNVPYAPTWGQSHKPPSKEQVLRRAKYKKLHANLDDRDEIPPPSPPTASFEPPTMVSRERKLTLENWPWSPEDAARRQANLRKDDLVLDLGGGVSLSLVPIPSGKFVMGDASSHSGDERTERVVTISNWFHLATTEVTNAQYARFDPGHDSAFVDGRGKDRITRGYPVNSPGQPAVRVTWHRATEFCRWLAARTGHKVVLPSEEEWEYACRAGTGTSWSFGKFDPKSVPVANLADERIRRWGWGRVESGYNDGVSFSANVGHFKPNAWRLHDMHGNVSEWTRSSHGKDGVLKIVRGGSWNHTSKNARSSSRWRYPAWQPVYNLGFRIAIRRR